MSPADIVRAAIPDADEHTIAHVVWGMTPFPFEVSARLIYAAAHRFVRAGKNGVRICEHCSNKAAPEEWCCRRCSDLLRRVREAA